MRKLLVVGGGIALLLLGILIGAVYGSARIASANTTAAAATTATQPTASSYCTQYQQNLANRLGISVSKLEQAEAGAGQDMLAQMVKDGKLTQAQADQIKSKIGSATACNFDALKQGNMGHFNQQLMMKYLASAEAQVAKGLGMSSSDLMSQLQSGKSLHDIASAQHVSDAQLKTLLTNAISSTLKQAVSAGDLTQSQADMVMNQLTNNPQMLNRLINGHMGQHNGTTTSWQQF